MKTSRNDDPHQPEPMLLPKGQTKPSMADRKKHPRLTGADLYVARLGWCRGRADGTAELPTISVPTLPVPAETGLNDLETSVESLSLSSSDSSTSPSCSLHDELTVSTLPPAPGPAGLQTKLAPSIIRASRPCYRCITYMASVGIKRVFWTNDAGEWEDGKVRDLVDALDNSMESVAKGADGGPTGNGVFVTKHEVLMLRRMMGN
jgi:hypothetical protein